MPVLAWRNDADGFAFVNSWTLDPVETAGLTAAAQPVVWSAVGAVAAILPIPDPILLTAISVTANIAIGRVTPTIGIGLCGGMAYASVDYWRARAPLPRGAHGGDQPTRASASGTLLRDYIWSRLLHSLVQGGALQRTLEWSLILNQVPAPIGGATVLKNRSATEWNKLKGAIDAGLPCPIGLVYSGRDVWDQHQILAYGYEDPGNGTGTLYVYDCNYPMQFGDTNHSIVSLDFTGPSLVATTPDDKGNTLAGFFCTSYAPVLPPALAPRYGQFLRWSGDPSAYMTANGARMPIADAAELDALGGSAGDVRAAPGGPTATMVRPRDNAMLRERNLPGIFLYQGGSPFHLPGPTWVERFGGWGAVQVVPVGSLVTFEGVPDEGTLLREWSAPEVFRMSGARRRWVPTPADLDRYGGFGSVRLVPDGALAAIPEAAYQQFRLQTGTALQASDQTFAFAVAASGDVFAIKKSGTGSGTTEIHVLSAASGYQQFSLQTGTALHQTDDTFSFCVGVNGDVFAIKRSGTASGSTEIHVLSAAGGYQQFSLQTGTALLQTDHTFDFCLAANGDVFAIKKSGTGTGTTELHVLSAASGYQQFSLQTGTALHQTDHTFDFGIAPNRDLVAIKKSGTGTGTTEIHVLSAARGYQQFSLQTGTVLHQTDANWVFAVAMNWDVFAITRRNTGSNTTEIHVLDW
jgi:hypothetical protein